MLSVWGRYKEMILILIQEKAWKKYLRCLSGNDFEDKTSFWREIRHFGNGLNRPRNMHGNPMSKTFRKIIFLKNL